MTSPMVVFTVLLVVLALSIIAILYTEHKVRTPLWKQKQKPSRISKDGWSSLSFLAGFVIFCAAVTLFAALIAYPVLRFGSTAQIAELEAFHDSTVTAFKTTAEETETVTIYVSDQALIDAGYWEQGLAVSDRLSELRDKIAWYNGSLNRNRHWNDMWFADGFHADAPDRLTYIEMEYTPNE